MKTRWKGYRGPAERAVRYAGDVDALADMTEIASDLDAAISQAMTGLREAGNSWAEIAVRLGVTRQAAQQRWGHRQ